MTGRAGIATATRKPSRRCRQPPDFDTNSSKNSSVIHVPEVESPCFSLECSCVFFGEFSLSQSHDEDLSALGGDTGPGVPGEHCGRVPCTQTMS